MIRMKSADKDRLIEECKGKRCFFSLFFFVEGFNKMSNKWLISNVTMIMKRFDC